MGLTLGGFAPDYLAGASGWLDGSNSVGKVRPVKAAELAGGDL